MKRLIRIISVGMTVILICMALAGCGTETAKDSTVSESSPETNSTRTITDMTGTAVEIPAKVDTYVESWFAHNAVDVMLDDAEGMLVTCADPAYYQWMYLVCDNMSKAMYAEFADGMNLEEIIAQDPDVVFGSNENYRAMFENVGIPYVNVMFSNLEEMKKSISLTAEVLGGDSPAIAKKYITYLDRQVSEIEKVSSAIPENDRKTVLHGDALMDLTVDGGNTIIDEWIHDVGAVNVTAEEIQGNKQTVTMEQILNWNPDFIITGKNQDEAEMILADSTWAGIKAVQDGNVVVNPKGVFTWDRYGVELALQLQWAAQLIYPEHYADLDIVKTTQEFYKEYFDYDLTGDEVKLILARENPDGTAN